MLDVVILAGGYGTRLQPILPVNFPKILAEVDGAPFLGILLAHLGSNGFRRVVLCCGHGKDLVQEYVDELWSCNHLTFDEVIITVQKPMGTWPALVNALPEIKSDPFIVLNGDTYCPLNYKALLTSHQRHGLMATVAWSNKEDCSTGVLVLNKRFVLSDTTARNVEGAIMETKEGVNFHHVKQSFWDIGTPASLEKFRRFWSSH
jgi:mannose-1-phosphate guanylyltransferase